VVELITTELDDPTTLEKFRVRSGDWTRKANLSFARVIWLILQGHHQSLQNNLNDFYKKIGAVQDVPTAAAYCQARQKVKPEIFGEVYRLRWRVETYLDRLKNIFELQRFGGKSTLTVEQDFYSLVFLANLESILTREAELEISIENQHRGRRYQYQVNHSVSYAAVRNYLPDLFLSSVKNREKSLEELKILFKKNTCAKRPNRKFPRKKTSSTHKFRYWKYDRRLIA
jgi:hypothetical protein